MTPIAQFVETIKLPVMTEVAQALIRTLNDEDADVVTVRDIIAQDPALTATLLRMANSATFGLSRTVTTLDSAVSIIGMAGIRARALGVCLSSMMPLPAGLDRIAFWQQCMRTAGYARWLALAIGQDENQAWLSGMLLRLGRIVVVQHAPQQVPAIEALPCEPGERWARERAACGFDEGEIMAEIARRWEFPDSIIETLSHCVQAAETAQAGTPEGAPRAAGVLHIAALLADHDSVAVETLATLPEALVSRTGLNLLWLGMHLPDPEQFTASAVQQQ